MLISSSESLTENLREQFGKKSSGSLKCGFYYPSDFQIRKSSLDWRDAYVYIGMASPSPFLISISLLNSFDSFTVQTQ